MRKKDIKRHLQDYSIYRKRKTTIVHAFASALSVADIYDETKIDDALKLLGQDPDKDLVCVYCTRIAETWDHVMAVVKDGKFSGFGHQIGNLLPCCKECNSKKGNKNWKEFLISKRPSELTNPETVQRIEKYIKEYSTQYNYVFDEDVKMNISELEEIKEHIFELMKRADIQAQKIRDILRTKIEKE